MQRLLLLLGACWALEVRLKVGMQLTDVSSGVHVAGSFNGWDPMATNLTDIDGDQVYEVVLSLEPGDYEFKFINGNSWDEVEEVPWACSEQKSGHFNRLLSIGDQPAELHVCFSACVPCDALPACKLFVCPPLMVHRPDRLEATAMLTSDCCEYAQPFEKDVVVRSAGWSDGNEASFWMDGKMIYATSNRGLTAMTLSIEGEVAETETFDTNVNSSGLEAFLDHLPENTTLLLGASDEASRSLSDRARALIASFGGRQIAQLAWRGSYALIGFKGGGAFAEAVSAPGQGMAVAVGTVPSIELPPTTGQWCDATAAIPATKGKLHSSGNLEIESVDGKCRYPLFERDSAETCLGGAWIVVLGTSNAQLLANTLLFMLAGDNAGDHIHFGKYNFHDFVIENGTVSYHNVIAIADMPACKQNTTGPNQQEQQCQAATCHP